MKRLLLLTTLLCSVMLSAKEYELLSPDGKISVHIASGERLLWSVTRGNEVLIAPSEASLRLLDGTVYGSGSKFLKSLRRSVNQMVKAQNFKRSQVHDSFNELTLVAKDFDLVFRAYDDGVAYRFVTKYPVTVESETAEFSFPEDYRIWTSYVKEQGTFDRQFFSSFENIYADIRMSEWDANRLAMLPLTVRTDNDIALCITEADLLNYPGMYLHNGNASTTMKGIFAAAPDEIEQGGHNMLQGLVKKRKPFIYRGECAESLPWRIVAVAEKEYKLADNDLVYRLSKPSKGDFSWVRPGKVAWDWWNDWNIHGVDFRAGINNDTYKYYIDFASENGIEYVILDEGWAVNLKADLLDVVPEIDLPMLCSYAKSKGVGLVLWAGYWAFNRNMEEVCRHYSQMGIVGWKIDFMDRDDQDMVAFYEKAARTAAKYHQIVDFHGAFKPAGLTRTWPNVLNFEGVAGLEQVKWASDDYDMVTYDVTIPFTRLVAGPADYTQGAMRNACKGNFKAVWSEPMSQGTRCRQLAQYVIYDAPFTMLCDSPSNYMKEKECTRFISEVPTVWDETVAVDGRIGEYVLMARRSGDKWYIAGLTDWNSREVSIDLKPFASNGKITLWSDGINADRAACDYRKSEIAYQDNITVQMAPGGGFVLVISNHSANKSFFPGKQVWEDTDGQHINAHGGGVLYHDGTYYFYGECKSPDTGAALHGVSVYSSKDLYNWRNEGVALAVMPDNSGHPIEKRCTLERPKVVFNKKTEKFVMWFHLELKGQGYRAALYGVAVSDSPTGPFEYLYSSRSCPGVWPQNMTQEQIEYAKSLEEPTSKGASWRQYVRDGLYLARDYEGGQMSRDMTIYVDDDGSAYHIFASEENQTLHVAKLTDDYLYHSGEYSRAMPGESNEAPAIFKKDGVYWMISSGCSGWKPNRARLSSTTDLMGEWTSHPNPCIGPYDELTFLGQSTFVLPVQGRENAWIFMADIWNPQNLKESRYIWLPVTFDVNGVPLLVWQDEWTLDEAFPSVNSK